MQELFEIQEKKNDGFGRRVIRVFLRHSGRDKIVMHQTVRSAPAQVHR